VSHRIERLQSSIERAVAQVLARGLADPRIRGLITVTSVRVLPDLSEARIGISIIPAEHAQLAFHGIESSAAYIRREVGKLIETRQLPHLVFTLDQTLKKQAEVLGAIDRAAEDLAKRTKPAPSEEDPS
jgi:ribosome-binding factor A